MALNTVTDNSASQTSTQSPQSATGNTNSQLASSLQPVIAGNQLNGGFGVSINNPVLSTVSLTAASGSASTAATTTSPSHHFSAGLLSIPVLLVIIALASVWFTNRSVKSTT